ncbi:MAG TPA: cobyric acid synthase [Bryobacteraceae bacterium]|jgi:adenosylcobyric acid synthase
MAKPIFIGGTSSHAGKSWMATAICAWLRSRGVRVAPFKAQNMSNNSYPCKAGGEIGRAQVAQAWACGLEPEPAMNPILLKPHAEGGSQIVVNGKVWKTLSAREYYENHEFLRGVVLDAYEDLASRFDVVVIEGAGSVTELNLRRFDLVNLSLVTRLAARWLLVGDIERGGVFGSIIGTVGLLTAEERSLLRALAVNKFRGDLSLFDEGRTILEARTQCPCLGVFPYASDIQLDDEDSLSIPAGASLLGVERGQRCAIIRFPRISNTTDFRRLPSPAWITAPVSDDFDFIFLPGTKSTAADLEWLRERGLGRWLKEQHERGATLVGICGGFQMLGRTIEDPLGMESAQGSVAGLGFLPVDTILSSHKTTRVVRALTPGGIGYSAYEIHLGETTHDGPDLAPFARFEDGSGEGVRVGRVVGTYLHGALEQDAVLRDLGISARSPAASSYARIVDWFAPFGDRFEELFL